MSVGKRNGTAALPLPLPATGLVGVKSTAPACRAVGSALFAIPAGERERERERERSFIDNQEVTEGR